MPFAYSIRKALDRLTPDHFPCQAIPMTRTKDAPVKYLGTTHYEGCGDANYDDPRHAGCKRTKVWPGSWEGKRNRIRCLHCNDVIEAFHGHDFKSCGCKKVSIDGGGCGHWRRLFPSLPSEKHFVEMP